MAESDGAASAACQDDVETSAAVNEALSEEGEGRAAAEVHAEIRKKHFSAAQRSPRRLRQRATTG